MNHTKEPWEVTNSGHGGIGVIEGDRGSFVAEIGGRSAQEIMANTSRIALCVNACADVEDDCLEQGYVKWLQQRIIELELSVMNLKEENARMKAMKNHLVTNGEWEDV